MESVSGCLVVAHQRGMFANCAHIIVSLLKDWKVPVSGIECDNVAI